MVPDAMATDGCAAAWSRNFETLQVGVTRPKGHKRLAFFQFFAYEEAGLWREAVEGSCMLWVWLFSSCRMIPAAARSLV